MAISHMESFRWAVTSLTEFAVLVLVFARRLFGRLPFFSAYVVLLVANELVAWFTLHFSGVDSRLYLLDYWVMQALLLIFRAAAIYELCRVLLSPYRGVWKLCRPLLVLVAAILLGAAAISAAHSSPYVVGMIIHAGRGMEISVAGVLLFGLAFCRYYGVTIERHLLWIGLGLGFYSAVQVANDTLLSILRQPYFSYFAALRFYPFLFAAILWIVALWKPLPARRPALVMLDAGAYGGFAPQMTLRLRELNSRLLEMWR